MTVLLAWEDAVDIGHGRGRLAADAAASLRRVDSVFGRAADVNEAWRSPQQADANYRAYVAYRAYLAGLGPKVPWAPLAYPAASSIHCRGYALDTDDTSTAQMRVWNDHGWFWTVYRNGVLVERWHLEYFRDRDNHRNEPAGGGATPIKKEWYEMALDEQAKADIRAVVREVLDEPRGQNQNQTSANIAFIVAQVKGEVDQTQPDRGALQLATAIRSIATIKGWLSFTRVKVHSIWARTLGRDPREGISDEDLAALDRIDGKPDAKS